MQRRLRQIENDIQDATDIAPRPRRTRPSNSGDIPLHHGLQRRGGARLLPQERSLHLSFLTMMTSVLERPSPGTVDSRCRVAASATHVLAATAAEAHSLESQLQGAAAPGRSARCATYSWRVAALYRRISFARDESQLPSCLASNHGFLSTR
jgi:hypothetical protein